MQAQDLVRNTDTGRDAEAHEDEPKDLPVGISIQGLTKIYDAVSPTTCTYIHVHCVLSIYL